MSHLLLAFARLHVAPFAALATVLSYLPHH